MLYIILVVICNISNDKMYIDDITGSIKITNSGKQYSLSRRNGVPVAFLMSRGIRLKLFYLIFLY